MRVFVAGATGVIGRALLPRLVEAGHKVIGMSNDRARNAWLCGLGVEPVVVDVFDRTAVAAAVQRAQPDVVIDELTSLHAADYAANARLRDEGTRNLVDAAMAWGADRFIAQSYALYGPGPGLATEGDPLQSPADDHTGSIGGIVRLERAVNAVATGVILRYGTLYGPGTWYAPGGAIARQFLDGEFVATDDVTSFVHVDDAAHAAVLALSWPKGTFNIVDDEPATANAWAPVLAKLIGAPPPRTTHPQATPQRGVSNAKARHDLAWQPIHPSWRDGFKTMFAAAAGLQRRSA